MTTYHLHLVSDATGETLQMLAKAAMVQFENIDVMEHEWPLVRREAQVNNLIEGIKKNPGLVLCTFADQRLRDVVEVACRDMAVPCLAILDPILAAMANYFHADIQELPGQQHVMNAEYFGRIEAMGFCLAHDDGQMLQDLDTADVVLVGVSRTSKTPTCMYLANRGLRVANVPFVSQIPIPAELLNLKNPMVIGLTTSVDRLLHIRKTRLIALNQNEKTNYVDEEFVKEEVTAARRLYEKLGWPIIDVSRRSIEETSAEIMNLYHKRIKPDVA
tara:strand:+ start:3093 stop:3914 length:822 start_codon:yes stop_codon:yes gene_type:complete